MSPTVTPGKGEWVFRSRMGTMKLWTPRFAPVESISCAMTIAVFADFPRDPGHNLVDVRVGVLMLNDSLALS